VLDSATMLAPKKPSKWAEWVVGTIITLLFWIGVELFFHFTDWTSKMIWGENIHEVSQVVLLVSIVVSVVAASAFLLGPRIHQLFKKRR